MIKKLLLLLLLIPTLCFAKIGEQREVLENLYGPPAKEQTYSEKTKLVRYRDPDGETLVIVVFYDNASVVETYFSKFNTPYESESIEKLIKFYSNEWVRLPVKDPNCRCVKSAATGYYRVCYGPIEGTKILYGLSILSLDAEAALNDMTSDTPYKKSNGLRL